MKRLQLTDGEISDILYVLDEKREVLYNEKNKLLHMEEGEITAHDRNVSKAIDEGYVLFTHQEQVTLIKEEDLKLEKIHSYLLLKLEEELTR